MLRSLSAFMLLVLVSWLMPLGAFIGVSQQKSACDGRRAFHMCSMMKGDPKASGEKVSLMSASSGDNLPKSQGSGGNDFVSQSGVPDALLSKAGFIEFSRIPVRSVFIPSIDPVPKI